MTFKEVSSSPILKNYKLEIAISTGPLRLHSSPFSSPPTSKHAILMFGLFGQLI